MAEHKKRYRGGHNKKHGNPPPKEEDTVHVDESSPVIQMFREFQKELDSRHDKHERIVKLSRDITIESKRTIFLLHRHGTKGVDSSDTLKEADDRLSSIEKGKFYEIAKELVDEDPHQFIRAYSPGLQEYIEALSFYQFLQDRSLIALKDVQARLSFQDCKIPASSDSPLAGQESESIGQITQPALSSDIPNEPKEMTNEKCTISVVIPPIEYILGIADLTGELMRRAINMVGSGDLDQPFEICTFLQEMEVAYNSLNSSQRELHRKVYTLRQSLRKVETACYTLKVRGSEIPKHMLVDVLSTVSVSDFINEPSMDEAE